MNTLRNFNWPLVAEVLFSLGVWTFIIWALCYGLAKVQ